MKTSNQLLLLGMLSALSAAAAAADGRGTGQPSTLRKWKCKFCPIRAEGSSGSVDVGAGYVSDKSAKFGEYNGLNKKGGYFIGDGAVRYRGADAPTGMSMRRISGWTRARSMPKAGRQGQYKLLLNYDELPHYISDSAQTPFVGNGGASLTLPAGFPAADDRCHAAWQARCSRSTSTRNGKQLGVGGSWTRTQRLGIRRQFPP